MSSRHQMVQKHSLKQILTTTHTMDKKSKGYKSETLIKNGLNG